MLAFRLLLPPLLLPMLALPVAVLAQDAPAVYRARDIANSSAPVVRLLKGSTRQEIASIPAARAKLIMEVKEDVEKQAGVAAELLFVEGKQPNAFASPATKTGPVVGINFAMIELVGDDRQAYAALLGHEYAHLTLKHRESRQGREGLRQAGSVILGLLLGASGVPLSGEISSMATQAVSTVFSRDEERAADDTGIKFAIAAGYDPNGAVRLWERMSARGGAGGGMPFLASHPASAERVENMRALARAWVPPALGDDVEGGRRIFGVVFAQDGDRIVVKAAGEAARTTLRDGDRIVSCEGRLGGVARVGELGGCLQPRGGMAFTVVRDREEASAVLLRPR